MTFSLGLVWGFAPPVTVFRRICRSATPVVARRRIGGVGGAAKKFCESSWLLLFGSFGVKGMQGLTNGGTAWIAAMPGSGLWYHQLVDDTGRLGSCSTLNLVPR